MSDRLKDRFGRRSSLCAFLSLEKIGVVITEARPPLSSDRGRLPRHFNAKAGQMIIASNWHPTSSLIIYLQLSLKEQNSSYLWKTGFLSTSLF